MDQNERFELGKILYGLASNFGDSLSEYGIEIWINAFTQDGITIPQIRKAAAKLLRTRKISKMPTYAEFVEQIQGDVKDRALIQADTVLEFLKYNGAKAKPIFDDPITQHLMTTRWKYEHWAASIREEETKWWIKEFVEAYQTYAKVGIDSVPKVEHNPEIKKLAAKIGTDVSCT